jgi:hypothetical protein
VFDGVRSGFAHAVYHNRNVRRRDGKLSREAPTDDDVGGRTRELLIIAPRAVTLTSRKQLGARPRLRSESGRRPPRGELRCRVAR